MDLSREQLAMLRVLLLRALPHLASRRPVGASAVDASDGGSDAAAVAAAAAASSAASAGTPSFSALVVPGNTARFVMPEVPIAQRDGFALSVRRRRGWGGATKLLNR